MDLASAVDLFLLDRSTHCSNYTCIWYQQMLQPLREWIVDANGITTADLNRLIVHLRTRERADLRSGPLSNRTIAAYVRALRIFFAWMVREGHLIHNPAQHIQPPRFERTPKALTLAQTQAILAVLNKGVWPQIKRDRALCLFLLDTGCRASEVLSAKRSQVNFTDGYIDVIGKGDKSRRIGLSPVTLSALKGLNSEYLFSTDDGGSLTRAGLREILRRLSKRVGIALHPHLFRHTFGTLFVADGGDVSHLQILMGHAQIQTTHLYIEKARAQAALKEHRRHSPVYQL